MERCRRPVMPSATTADSSDSIEPSSANATALGRTANNLSHEIAGKDGSGRLLGMPPNCEPIVVTGRCQAAATAAAAGGNGR
mgnify:CR=1 FL=1